MKCEICVGGGVVSEGCGSNFKSSLTVLIRLHFSNVSLCFFFLHTFHRVASSISIPVTTIAPTRVEIARR